MKTLTELSFEEALATPTLAEQSLRDALSFTHAHTASVGLDAAAREAQLLRHQFPRILRPLQRGDAFAGRIRYGLVGFSPEPCGLGYYCARSTIEAWLASGKGSEASQTMAREILDYWRGRTTAEQVRAAYPPSLAATIPSDAWFEESGVGFPLYRMAGTVLDYGTLVAGGIDGLRCRIQESPTGGTPLGAAMMSALDVLQTSIRAYRAQAEKAASEATDPGHAREWSAIARTLAAIDGPAPQTLREAIQLIWLFALHSGTFNYGRLDDVLGPFLERDLLNGTLPNEAQAVDLLADWWRLICDYDNQYNNRIIVGGRGRRNEKAADHFALLAIEATRRVRRNQPQLSLRWSAEQDPRLWEAALTAIGEGCTFPMLYNDDVNILAVARAFGVDEELAAQYTPYGCGEYVLSHYSEGTPNGVINLLKALEVALHGGRDPLTNRQVFPRESLPTTFETFEDVWAAYTAVTDHYVAALAEQEALCYQVTARETPMLYISMLTSDCLERGRGAFGGGVRHLGGTLETYGNSNTADSLLAIERLVFADQCCSLPDLMEACNQNFAGRAELLSTLLALPKYGNGDPEADAMARRVHDHICHVTRQQAARVGLDSYLVVIINNWANTILGRYTLASADGRREGAPMANGNNPSPGSDRSGVTAFLSSLASLPADIHAGAVQNMKFSPEWFGRQRPNLTALLRGYFEQGGTQAMITVLNRRDLEAALEEPEKWGHLMVRVGGFSIRFVDLPADAQREVLARTLH